MLVADEGFCLGMTRVLREGGNMRVGLFGAGGIGRVHAQAYAEIEGARLVAVADIDRAAADKLAAQHGAQAYYDCQHLLDNAEIDMVDVCLPTYCHEWAVVAAAARRNTCSVKSRWPSISRALIVCWLPWRGQGSGR